MVVVWISLRHMKKLKVVHYRACPLKTFLYFPEMELSGSNIKKFLIFQETETLKNFLHFRK